MNVFQDAFISYGRADSKDFAARLNQRLVDEELTVWFDFEDIPLGVDYQKQIDDGIEKADNFLFLISPHSVNSPYCGLEVELALKRGKRIIPILHVEEVSRETWQQRNPQGTDADWQAYQAEGKHSSFPNMHPAIGKINWIYMREGLDDFEQGVQALLAIFERQKDYVNLHTRLLIKALDWEEQHRRSPLLLLADERERAEDWLLTRFKDAQPPCIPTDLHCEFITESMKNARNLMTQVFLAHAEADKESAAQVRCSLMRSGITVWTNTTDIHTGTDFDAAIRRGIEEADNLVYLLSPAALQSDYCQRELDYALFLQKRVIPVLAQPMDGVPMPDALKTMQYIDLTDNVAEGDYQKDESDLLRILRREAEYYDTHKQLLVKALKWKAQDCNASILLRGYNLRHGEKWLHLAQAHDQHRPTSFHKEFIEASLRQPPATSLDVFISYSRTDAEFARRLNDTLQIQGKTTWFDQESIAAGTADFQKEIEHGIEVSDNFLFILSPNAIRSDYCAAEVEYAAKLSRRMVTVLYRPIDTTELHPELAKVQWLDFCDSEESFMGQFNRLVRSLETDREHVHSHTKWSQRALEWDQKGRGEDLLLRGNELAIAQEWLKKTRDEQKRPDATELQEALVEFSQASVDASIQREIRQAKRLRFLLNAVSTALVATMVASVLTFFQSRLAVRRQVEALTEASQAAFTLNRNTFDALLKALEAGTRLQNTVFLKQDPELRAEVMTVLAQSSYWVRERDQLTGHADRVQDVSFSSDGTMIATASIDRTVKLWNQKGKHLRTFSGHADDVISVAFSPDGTLLASASHDQTVKLWHLDKREPITINGHQDRLRSVSFSPDGQTIATASDDQTVRLWTLEGEEILVLNGHEAPVNRVQFSPDGTMLATASYDNTAKLWTREGQLIHTFSGHQNLVLDVSFSPDGQLLATTSFDHTVILWDVAKQTRQQTLKGHQDFVTSVRFSPDGQMLATASGDETIKLWTLNGKEISTLQGHNGLVLSIDFSPDGHTLASASGDKTVKSWRLDSPNLRRIEDGHDDAIYSVDFSPDGQQIATTGEDLSVRLWTPDGNLSQILTGHLDTINSVRFSPDSLTFATASNDKTVKLWRHDGQEINTLSGHQDAVVSVRFSSDGQLIGTASFDKTAKLWTRDGTLIHTLAGHNGALYSISFSPDNQMIATASEDNTIKLWTIDGNEIRTLTGHEGEVYQVRFSPDGQMIASVSEDNTGKLWRLDGTELGTLDSHIAGVWDINFSPSGQIIATSSDDDTIKLWHRDGTLMTTITGHDSPVNGLSFSSDGNTLTSVDSGQKILMWNIEDLTLEGILNSGCNWLEDYLKNNRSPSRRLCKKHINLYSKSRQSIQNIGLYF